jgi:hypothetical protein
LLAISGCQRQLELAGVEDADVDCGLRVGGEDGFGVEEVSAGSSSSQIS